MVMSVPPRWLNCPRKSQIIAEKFLAFKTPLGPRYDEVIPEANRFDLPMLFAYLQSLKMRLGLIVDLTNTNGYYDKKDVEETGIRHKKMRLKGHKKTPSKKQVRLFIGTCDGYFSQKCRPPGIYIKHYLEELMARYGDANKSITAPELPDWCLEEEKGLSNSEEQNGNVEDGSH